jgi:hypothetical protein
VTTLDSFLKQSLLQKGVKNILTLMGSEHWLVSMMKLSVERAKDLLKIVKE